MSNLPEVRQPGQIITDDQRSPLAITPSSFTEVLAIAAVLVKSKLTPFDSADQVALVILDALEKGKPMVQHLQSRYVVHGRVGLYADAMVADVLSSGKARFIRPVETSDTICSWETVRSDWPEDAAPAIFSFSISDAKKAGFMSNKKYVEMPQRMLSARAKSYLCRDIYPDVMAGVYSVEELEDEEIMNPTPSRRSPGRRTAPKKKAITAATTTVEAKVVDELTGAPEPAPEPEAPHDPAAGEVEEPAAPEEKPSLLKEVEAAGKIMDEANETVDTDPEAASEHLKKAVPMIFDLKEKGLDDGTLSILRTSYGDTQKIIRNAIKAKG